MTTTIQEHLFPAEKRYFIRPGVTDMRKSSGSLASLVENDIGISPMAGDYYLFCNRQKNIVKILYWHINGFALWTKRLEKDKFPWPASKDELVEMSEGRLLLLLSGIDARKEHRPLVYSRAG